MSDKREDYLTGMSILWELPWCQGCVPRIRILRSDAVLWVRTTRFCPWDTMDFRKVLRWWISVGEGRRKSAGDKVCVFHTQWIECHIELQRRKPGRSKLYVSLFPCNECAKAIIQSGIKEVIYDCDKYADTPSVMASKRMMDAAGVRYHQYHRSNREIKIKL